MDYKSRYGGSKYKSTYSSNRYGSTTTPRKTEDITDIEDLKEYAKSKGLDVKEKKPPLFTRVMDLMSRSLYASAGAAKALVKGEDVAKEALKGFSGKEKETYSDVLGEMGVKNKIIKGGAGFVLDVLLDPATYVGGTIFKAGGKVLGGAGKIAMKGIGKIAPETAQGLNLAKQGLKDAVGSAFKFGYGTTAGLADDVIRAANRIGIAKEDIVAGNIKRFKGFAKEELQEAGDLMIENRRLELASRGGEEVTFKSSKNENVNKLLTLFEKKATELSELAGISKDKAYRYYIPFLRKDASGIAESTKILQSTPKNWLKEFKDKIPDEKLLNKPVEAYSRREFEIVRSVIGEEAMANFIKAYGKQFKNAEEAIANGFTPIYKQGKLQFFPVETAAGKVVHSVKKASPIGYLKDADAKFINTQLFPDSKTLDALAKASGYDKLTRWFKTAVTAYFPAFHIRNIISGNIQNYSVLGAEALYPVNHVNGLGFLRGTDKVVKFKKWTGTGAEMKKLLEENFRGSSRYLSDLGNYIEESLDGGFKLKSAIAKLDPRQVGNFIEMWQKSTAVSAALRKGHTIEEALKLAEKAGFDYNKITQFERKVMKRLIPFYTFARKNAELQINTLVNNPARILNQAKFADGLSNIFGESVTEEDLKGLPSWVLDGLGFKIKDGKYVSQLGFPLEEFMGRVDKPMQTTLSSLNPLVKYPLERKLGYDFFREKKIIDINSVAPATAELLLKAKENGQMPEWLDRTINLNSYEGYDGKTKYTMSPKVSHFLRNIPTARLQNTLEKIFDNDMDKVDKWMAFLSGGKIYDINLEQQMFFDEKDLRRDIQDQLLNMGIGKEQNLFYIYK